VLAAQGPNEIVNGFGSGQVPVEYAGGIGQEGITALRAFVEEGGMLVTIDSASLLPIQRFNLPVQNDVALLSTADFYGPGSILRTEVDTDHPLGFGSPVESIAWFEQKSGLSANRQCAGNCHLPDGRVTVAERMADWRRAPQWPGGGRRGAPGHRSHRLVRLPATIQGTNMGHVRALFQFAVLLDVQ
jgi:hypothetical protein